MTQPTEKDLSLALREHILAALPDARVEVRAHGGGHFSLEVESATFRGQLMLACHRLVMAAIAPLMAGNSAPVHAIDQLKTRTPPA